MAAWWVSARRRPAARRARGRRSRGRPGARRRGRPGRARRCRGRRPGPGAGRGAGGPPPRAAPRRPRSLPRADPPAAVAASRSALSASVAKAARGAASATMPATASSPRSCSIPTGSTPNPMAAKSSAGHSQPSRPRTTTRSPGSSPSRSRPKRARRMASRSSFQSGTHSSVTLRPPRHGRGAHVMAQAEVVEARQRRRDRVERARPPALRRVAPEDVLGGDVEEHGAQPRSRVQSASTSGSLDAVQLHRVDERPHVLDARSHDAVRGAQARLDRLQVGPAVTVRRPRHPHPGVHGSLGGLGRPGLPPALLGGLALLEGALHRAGARRPGSRRPGPSTRPPGARPRIGQGDSGVPQRRRDSCRKARR